MDPTIFQLLTDGFFDDPLVIHCDHCGSKIQGQYFTDDDDGSNYCRACVDSE